MRIVNTSELVSLTAAALGQRDCSEVGALVKAALRRACYLLAPCSSAELIRFVVEPLGGTAELSAAAERALDESVVYGDILEMRRIEGDSWDVPAVVLRPAPPSFVMRSSDEAIVVGVSGDLPSPLPDDLAVLVQEVGPVRVLSCPNDPDLAGHLKALGMAKLNESIWLRLPAPTPANKHVEEWKSRLGSAPISASKIDGLEIIDPEKPPSFYRGRWRLPAASDTGVFVGRRPQAYGANLWSVVELAAGEARHILDLLPSDNFERGCDVAWRIQAAIDASRGTPQQFGILPAGDLTHLSFYGPLPAFAERRLALVATKSSAPGSLFRFSLPMARLEAEVASLQATLWMQPNLEGQRQ